MARRSFHRIYPTHIHTSTGYVLVLLLPCSILSFAAPPSTLLTAAIDFDKPAKLVDRTPGVWIFCKEEVVCDARQPIKGLLMAVTAY